MILSSQQSLLRLQNTESDMTSSFAEKTVKDAYLNEHELAITYVMWWVSIDLRLCMCVVPSIDISRTPTEFTHRLDKH